LRKKGCEMGRKAVILGALIFFVLASVALAQVQVGTISGTVLNANTSEPIKNAWVYVAFKWTATDENGQYTIEDIPVGTHSVMVFKCGYYPATQEAEVLASQTTTVDFSLTPIEPPATGTITGKVTDATTSLPIESAFVFTVAEDIWECFGRFSAMTDSNGDYTIENVPVGMRKIFAFKRHYHHASQMVHVEEGLTTTVNFALYPIHPVGAGRVAGTVVDAATSAPIENAWVFVKPLGAGYLACRHNTLNTQTDENGEYLIDDVPAGECLVAAFKRGYHLDKERATVVANETTTVDFVLRPFSVWRDVHAVVLNARSDQPIEGAAVVFSIYEDILPTSDWNFWQGNTDAMGSSLIAEVPAGNQLLVVSKAGYEPAALDVMISSSGARGILAASPPQTITIKLEPAQGQTAVSDWTLY
jgi:hypothetical protein